MSDRVAVLKYDEGRKKWVAMIHYHGQDILLCQSRDRDRVIRLIQTGECDKANSYGVTRIEHDNLEENIAQASAAGMVMGSGLSVATPNIVRVEKPHFTVEERFQFLSNFTDMVIEQRIPSLLVTGGAGLGKTFTVTKRLEAHGLINSVTVMNEATNRNGGDDENEESGNSNATSDQYDYVIIKGYSSPRAMYDRLYYNRNKLVVFDDCDKVLTDSNAVNILKAALESTEHRWVWWNVKMREDDPVPDHFEFTGGVIFLSNLPINSVDSAVRSRSIPVDLELTIPERLERMEKLLPYMLVDVEEDTKWEVLDFIKENAHYCKNLNLRTFILVTQTRLALAATGDWKRQSLFTMQSQLE